MMLQSVISELASPRLVATFQRWCGVEQVGPSQQHEEARTATANGCHHRSTTADDSNRHAVTHTPHTHHHIDNNYLSLGHHHTPLSSSTTNGLIDHSGPHPNGSAVSVNGCVNDVLNDCGNDADLWSPAHHQGSVSNGVAPACCSSGHPSSRHDHPEKYPSNGTTGSLSECSDGHDDSCSPVPASTSNPQHRPALVQRPGRGRGVCEEERGCGGGSECQEGGGGTPPAPRVVIRYPLLYCWARVGAALGNEVFYLTGMPFLLWTVDSAVIRQTAVLWWLVMYVGQALKDYLGWPRPPSPPVVHLETTHLAEYAMPSTHAMAGTAIPLLLATLLLERYQVSAVAVVCVAAVWWATTCLSRLYLGVHTVLDVVCGVLLALMLYVLCSPLIPLYDEFQQTHPLAPLVLLLSSLALCTVCYPSCSRQSAKEDAVIITAVIVGVGIGAWLNYQLGWSHKTQNPSVHLPMPVPAAPSLSWLGTAALQFVVGVGVVGVVKVVLKPVTMWCFQRVLLGVERRSGGRGERSGVVTLGYKYTTYLCLGLCMVWLDPLIFTVLGFGRPGYYHEVV